MNLPDLKQLDKIIALCRKRGVKSIKIDNVELTLSEDVPTSKYKAAKAAKTPQGGGPDLFNTDELSSEELLFWSADAPAEGLKSE